MLGWPVSHSRSPAIQNAALRAAGLERWRYQLLPVPPPLLAEIVKALPAAGFRGANVTIPHKQAALALASAPTERARAIGAANTITFESDQIAADNTDAPALIAALPLDVAGASALVLGAGGAARAAVWALRDAGAGAIRVWNRTPERARELSQQLGGTAVAEPTAADLLINCTSVGLDGSDSLPIAAGDVTALRLRGRLRLHAWRDGPDPRTRAGTSSRPSTGSSCWSGKARSALSSFTGRPAPTGAMRTAAGLYGASGDRH